MYAFSYWLCLLFHYRSSIDYVNRTVRTVNLKNIICYRNFVTLQLLNLCLFVELYALLFINIGTCTVIKYYQHGKTRIISVILYVKKYHF